MPSGANSALFGMYSTVFGHAETPTSPTLALNIAGPTRRVMKPQVGSAQWMAPFAMGLVKVGRLNRVATQGILSHRDNFEVIGINARRYTAQVVHDQPVRDWPKREFIRKAVGSRRTSIATLASNPEVAVAILVKGCLPKPALAGIHATISLLPEPLFNSKASLVKGIVRILRTHVRILSRFISKVNLRGVMI